MEKPEQFKSRKDWEESIWQRIVKELVGLESENKAKQLLEGLISDYERQLIIRRLTATLLLREGLNYREIGEILWVSPSTISSIKKNLTRKLKFIPRKRAVSPYRVEEIDSSAKGPNELDNFIANLENLLEDILKGKADPKYRWRFLRK